MKHKLVVPDIGAHDTLEFIGWRLAPGAAFQAGDEICELQTDKAVFPLEAESAGRLLSQTISGPVPLAVTIGQELGYYEYD